MIGRDRYLAPLEPERPKEPKVIGIDTETDGLGGALLALSCTKDTTGPEVIHFGTNVKAFIEHFMRKRYRSHIGLIHNMEYDLRYLYDELLAYVRESDKCWSIKPIMRSDGKMIQVTVAIGKHRWYFQDSYALMTTPLAQLCRLAGFEKLDIGLKDGVTFDASNVEHIKYLERDCLMVREAYRSFTRLLYETFQVRPRVTAGSTAIKAIQRRLERPMMRPSPTADAFIRKAIAGGIAYVTDVNEHHEPVEQYDANGMYAWAMKQEMPLGSPIMTRKERPGYLGIYRCVVTVPEDCPFTFIPCRYADGHVGWNTGRFEGYLATPTIEHARKRGIDVEVFEGYIWASKGTPFKSFIDECEQLEVENKGEGLGDIIKILRNAGYGKFGQKEYSKRIVWSSKDLVQPGSDPPIIPVIDQSTGEIIENAYEVMEKISTGYMIPQFSVFTTSYARIHLEEFAAAIDYQLIGGGDTDSHRIKKGAKVPSHLIGKRYGQWKLEGTYTFFQQGGPKNYQGIMDGKEIDKCKGIPKIALDFGAHRRSLSGENVSAHFRMIPSTKARITRGLGFFEEADRSYSNIDNATEWVKSSDGRVRPKKVESNEFHETIR